MFFLRKRKKKIKNMSVIDLEVSMLMTMSWFLIFINSYIYTIWGGGICRTQCLGISILYMGKFAEQKMYLQRLIAVIFN